SVQLFGGAASLPNPETDVKPAAATQTAIFAGGCFWCTEAVFEELKGVKSVVSGYAGGKKQDANYKAVSAGTTEHAESIKITFDPKVITYGQLLRVFFETAHDPTTLNRQGPDWGKQYRSVIFYVDDEQKRVAEAYVAQLTKAKAFPKPIVTQIVPGREFFPAEDYHQDFVKNNPGHPYVVANAIPKIQKTRKQFPDLVKSAK
ncbi:MAG TPA: peptide-methionine (S)-S-oxide reductase MsrA, partial [Bryobacteraceae bacterium]|nr:peptide-methionine (S)-S-oxide reductase MsrA [Bryobacteraceae bacterium]